MLGLIGAIITAAIFVISATNSEPTQQMKRLTARLDALQSLIDEGRKNAQNPDLKKINSDAFLLVVTAKSRLSAPLKAAGADKADAASTDAEKITTTLASLKEAKVNGRFDDVYYTALYQKIDSTLALIREIREKTTRTALKTELETTENYLNNLLDQLTKLQKT